MPCWRACGPARWGRRSSYGNGFAIFSRYITEPRDLASESSRPTPDIRLSALIRAIVSPWKGVSEPPSFATVKYRKFSSIPLPCPKEQRDAGGRRRAIAGLHGAVVHGMRGDPLRTREPLIDAPAARASQGRRPVPAAEPGERRDRAASAGCPPCEKPNPKINQRFPRRRIRLFWRKGPCARLHRGEHARLRAAGHRRAPAPPTARSGDT